MGKKNKDTPTEKELLETAMSFLIREYQDDPRFVKVESWRECGEYGIWLCVSELIDDAPDFFMDFELDQKVI